MSKTDNVAQLIHTIGCTIIIGLPIVQMNKLLKQFAKLFQACSLIMEWAMLLSIVFISFAIVINFKPLFSQLKMETIQFLIDLK